jgi:glycosyltransferase involved in cell wall biosynthesis
MTTPDQMLRVSLTNVSGLGAAMLAHSLLPALEATPDLCIGDLYLPDIGALATYRRITLGRTLIYRRYLPKALSRILECTIFARHFDGPTPLLVLGDLPLNTTAPQIVFVQSPHVVRSNTGGRSLDMLRYQVARMIFRANLHRVRYFIVQSEAMRDDLQVAYAIDSSRICIIGQPPPHWLLVHGKHRREPRSAIGSPLRLIYPAAGYPHKNHALLASATHDSEWPVLVQQLVLTIDPQSAPSDDASLLCTGRLASEAMVAAYDAADALLFLSKAESYGFPLVEAMWIGLPIVCPDLPYARTLCGDAAIYFDPDKSQSLVLALRTLRERLDHGWWPDWTERLEFIPADWAAVGAALRDLVFALGQIRPSVSQGGEYS